MKKMLMISAIVMSLFAATAFATNYYVAPTGSDSNPGTQSQPFLTIQKGINSAVAGDTVHVQPGTYNTPGLTSSSSGNSGAPITIISDTKWAAKVIVTNNPDSC